MSFSWTLAVTHTVGIELATTLRDPIKVTVLEVVPVTDEKAIEVKVVSVKPTPEVYDQASRGSPIRGGKRFEVTVGPGKKSEIEIVYRLLFTNKIEIVGGNRRG